MRTPHVFPGRIRPGLIEADLALFGGRGQGRRFPGRIRPGLIEATLGQRLWQLGGECFRGGFAPASLKLGDEPAEAEARRRRFPGRIRPGLIEATASPGM